MVNFEDIKNKLKNNGDCVDLSTEENEIYIHYGDYTFNKRKKFKRLSRTKVYNQYV